MRIGAPSSLPGPDSPAPSRTSGAGSSPGFDSMLQQRLAEPRDRIELTRSTMRDAIDQIRGGAVFAGGPARSTSPGGGGPTSTPNAAGYAAYSQLAPTRGADPFGWRTMTRQLGDDIVGGGFGSIFERQIQQESGFSAEVAFGFRRSTAGAEGIAQLMPQYYPGVDRTDPQASLTAGAQTMKQYLTVFDGDVRMALASYNAGLGRVRGLVDAHGADWERALPAETRQYLQAILGPARPQIAASAGGEPAVFGGRGPGGVLTWPLDRVLATRGSGDGLSLLGAPGAAVRAPAEGVVTSVQDATGGTRIEIDHGNGWRSTLEGLGGAQVAAGQTVRRGEALGALGSGAPGASSPELALAVTLDGRSLDPARYLLGSPSR